MILLNNLHPAMNKDPQSINALAITGTGTIIIKNSTMQIIGASSSAQFNLKSYTLGSLTTAINGISGISATNSQSSSLSALVLIDGTYSLPCSIPMFTSFLWQLLKPIALAILDALGSENQALLEMVLNTSDVAWLDSFGELFGIYRENGEPDQLYAIRIFDFSVSTRVNNLAIQKALNDLSYNATVTDNGTAKFDVNVTLPNSPPQGFVYSYSQIGDLVNLLRAAGTVANIILSGTITDTVSLSDSISSTLNSSTWTWGNFTWGQFTWGNN